MTTRRKEDDVGGSPSPSPSPSPSSPPCRWPIAAASRIRVKAASSSSSSPPPRQYCRLFHLADEEGGSIVLVPCHQRDDDDVDDESDGNDVGGGGVVAYDDSDAHVESEPGYVSYLASMAALSTEAAGGGGTAVAVDSFRPADVVGATLSLGLRRDDDDDDDDHEEDDHDGGNGEFFASIVVHSYPRLGRCGRRGRRTARRLRYILDPKCCIDFRDARALVGAIRSLSCLDLDYRDDVDEGAEGGGAAEAEGGGTGGGAAVVERRRRRRDGGMRLLVVVNPCSGPGNAVRDYEGVVRPMLECASAVGGFDTLVTERPGHAMDRMREIVANGTTTTAGRMVDADGRRTKDVSEYDGILAMGGDGILFEILHGIHYRESGDSEKLLSRLKFGLLPCGTYNGLVESLNHEAGNPRTEGKRDHVEIMMNVCKGRTRTLDLASYRVFPSSSSFSSSSPDAEGRSKTYISFLTYAWGLIADCDYESECLRWLGHARSDVWAVYRGILSRKRYRARFSYLPPPSPKGDDAIAGGGGGGAITTIMPEMRGGRTTLPPGWVTFDDEEFLVFWVCNTTHAAHNMFTCPVAKMDDGLFHVLIVR